MKPITSIHADHHLSLNRFDASLLSSSPLSSVIAPCLVISYELGHVHTSLVILSCISYSLFSPLLFEGDFSVKMYRMVVCLRTFFK
jgi:hypothetical protein